jgi:hypothetical protein
MIRTAMQLLAACAFAAPVAAIAQQPPTQGGSTQVSAQSGCMNEWMFDGVWRVRVTNVAWRPAGDKPNGWDVAMQWANGTSISALSPVDTGKQHLVLALENGDTLSADDSTTGALNEQQLDFHTFPASGQFSYTQTFYSGQTLDQNNKATKLLVTFDVATYKKNHPGKSARFWNVKTPAYNYRIDLTCSK